jgi:5-oxoprolinase (ATP-hydrolysing) subunit A
MKINADLGENEPPARTAELMAIIDLANIACGVHAGTPERMRDCVGQALEHGVAIGAHPGLATEFGRGAVGIDAVGLARLVRDQAGLLVKLAPLHHIKLHGALYHAVERSPGLAEVYVRVVQDFFPGVVIVAFASGLVLPAALAAGLPVLAEVFAERSYRTDGSLVPRGEPGDLIEEPAAVLEQLPKLRGDTICIHADSPNAVAIARSVRAALSQ